MPGTTTLRRTCVAVLSLLASSGPAAGQQSDQAGILEQMRDEAAQLRPLVTTQLAGQVLDAVPDLPAIESTRIVYWRGSDRIAISEAAAMELDQAERDTFRRLELGERYYYQTSFGTPLAYTRALDLAAASGFETADGARVFDFGFGTIGHLRLLASLGAHVLGSEVLDILREFYGASDVGSVPRAEIAGEGDAGSITLHYGQWPADREITDAIGDGFDLILSKNVLKLEYVHPTRSVDPRMLVHLGVSDTVFVRSVFDCLAPGGLFVIYNLYPPRLPEDQPYQPWRSGECPFDRWLVESVGFEVLAFNVDDTAEAHRYARALGWDQGDPPMDLMNGLRGMYTILRKQHE